jgi:hypothetical protein
LPSLAGRLELTAKWPALLSAMAVPEGTEIPARSSEIQIKILDIFWEIFVCHFKFNDPRNRYHKSQGYTPLILVGELLVKI